MMTSRFVGIILLIAAAVLLGFGINATHAFGEKVVEGFTGKYTDNTMLYLISGAVCAAAGAALTFFGFRKSA
jgi:hypothetical protein